MKKLFIICIFLLSIVICYAQQDITDEQLSNIQYQSCMQARDADANIYKITIEKQRRQIDKLNLELKELKGK